MSFKLPPPHDADEKKATFFFLQTVVSGIQLTIDAMSVATYTHKHTIKVHRRKRCKTAKSSCLLHTQAITSKLIVLRTEKKETACLPHSVQRQAIDSYGT